MLNLRALKILRDIWVNKARTGLVVLTIAIGVFSVGSLGRAWVILGRNLNDTYLAANPASASLTTARPFDESVVERIRRIPEVEDAEGRNGAFGRVMIGPNRWRAIQLVARTDFEESNIDIIEPESGDWPLADDTLLLERSSLAMLPFEIGDTITIEFNRGLRKEIKLVGTVHDVTQVSSAFTLVNYGYITPATLEALTGAVDYSMLDITVADDPYNQEHIERVLDLVNDEMRNNGQLVVRKEIPEPGKHPLDNIVQSVLLLLAVLSGLAMLLSVFLVVNIISALLTQQTQQIGTMKAVGGVSSQVLMMYLASVALFGLLALIASVPAGVLFSRLASAFFAGLINFDIVSYDVPTTNFMLEIFAGVVVPNIAALYPILKAASLTVREAIGGTQSAQFGVSGFEKLLSQIPGLPATVLYPFRNVFRRKVRLALATITLSVAGAILIAVFSVRASFQLTVDGITQYWQEDISVLFYAPQPFTTVEKIVMDLPEVQRVEPRLTINAFRERPDETESTRTIEVFGLIPDSPFIQPQVLEGRWLLPGDTNAVVVNLDLLSLESDIKVGDELVLGLRGKATKWTVVGIVTSQVIGGGDLLMSPIAYVNYPQLAEVMDLRGRANRILIGTRQHRPLVNRRVMGDLETVFADQDISLATVLLNSESRAALDDAFEILLSLLQVASVVFGVVGGLGLMSMMTLNVLERTREVGIIRSVGGVQFQLGQIVVIEGVFVGLLSWVLAVILAFPLSIVLGNALGQTLLRTPLINVFPPNGPLIWLGLVVVIAVFSSLLPARNAARLSIRETLAYE